MIFVKEELVLSAAAAYAFTDLAKKYNGKMVFMTLRKVFELGVFFL